MFEGSQGGQKGLIRVSEGGMRCSWKSRSRLPCIMRKALRGFQKSGSRLNICCKGSFRLLFGGYSGGGDNIRENPLGGCCGREVVVA